MIKFRRIDTETFVTQYGDATVALEEEDIQTSTSRTFGEVNVPGHGWMPCVMGESKTPTHFYCDDDGWQPVPRKALFVEAK